MNKAGKGIARVCLVAAWILTHSSFLVPRSCLAQVITTVAGSTWVFRGDGLPAANAPIGRPFGVALDQAGNLFVADPDNGMVLKITPNGTLAVVAGNGIRGFSGDGGPATRASFFGPCGVAADATGNLYISEREGHRIRRVTATGNISTVAGRGIGAFSGDGGPASAAFLNYPCGMAVDAAGSLYIAERFNQRIRKINPSGTISTVAGNGAAGYSGDGGPATSASLNHPVAVAVDPAGNLFIADANNYRIRKVTPAGTISTVAGNGTLGFSGDGGNAAGASIGRPDGVAVDLAGNLYLTAGSTHSIRKVNPAGIISSLATGGLAVGFLNYPFGIAADATGNLFVGDSDNYRILRVTAAGTVGLVAGNRAFKFSGDGGPATSASLYHPTGVAVDLAGNIYHGDIENHRVRKVSPAGIISTVAGNGILGASGDGGPATRASLLCPCRAAVAGDGSLYIALRNAHRIRKVTLAGTITTVAGTGVAGFSGDGGPATSARLNLPERVAVDAGGNLYIAESGNHRIRKVNPAGTISTVAGNGLAGSFGDSGPAIGASLNGPFDVALDAAGNIYIADLGNYRIRRVSTTGTISTVAGNGSPGSSGDGGPATSASISKPQGVAIDAANNIYIADASIFGRIRRVSPAGIITTIAGNGLCCFSGDGGLAVTASLDSPQSVATDTAGNIYIADTENDRIRKVLAAPPAFSVLPASLNVSASSGDETPVARQVAVTSEIVGLAWSAQTSDAWLGVSPASGTVPGFITISVDASSLSPGTYRGTVTVTASLALPTTQRVTVDLTVAPALAPLLSVEPGSIVVEVPVGTGNPPQQSLRVSNKGGGGTLRWTARGEALGGGNWLGVLSTSGSASGRAAASIPVRLNVAGLQPGIYSGLVEVSSPVFLQTQTIPVTLLLSQQPKTILTTQRGLRFTAVEGSRTTVAQNLGVVNTGQGSMDWALQATTLSGRSWLSVTPPTGQSQAGSVNLATASVQVDAASLTAGSYTGLLRVEAPGANNSPYLVTVELEVLPAGTIQGVHVRPPQLIFTAQAGTSSPGSQTVRLVTPRNANVEARGGLITLSGGNWLEVLPSNLVLSASDPRTVVVQPTLGNLSPGVHRGALTFQFSDGSEPQVVEIIFLVVGTTASAASRGDATACTAQQLIAADKSLGKSFTATAGSAATLELQVIDDCANAVTDATVVATFSNGDPPVTLAGTGDGTYSATWRPVTAAEQVTVMIRANQGSLPVAEVRAQGKVQSNDQSPALFAGGIVNAASFAAGVPLAPGGILSVFGRNLATATTGASSLPLPRTLAGATLQIGGIDVPLFFASTGQINAQLPYELPANTRQQVVVRGTSTITVPETITIAPARPGIFTTDGKQGAVLDTQGRLVDGSAPAAAGDIVVVYATGLGAVDRAVQTGQAAPVDPPAKAVTTVTATTGGQNAVVHFAGLTPGFVGLYQVNVQIPAGVAPGTTQLVILQSGVPSNTVTLAVR